MKGTANPIDVVEAAYDLESDEATWLANLATLLRPVLDGGLGVMAYCFDLARGRLFPPDPVLLGMSIEQYEAMVGAMQLTSRVVAMAKIMHVYPQPFGALRAEGRRAGLGDLRAHPEMAPFFDTGVDDSVSLRTIEPGGAGVMICGPQLREIDIGRRTARLWAHVAAHVAAARRLRVALAASASASDSPDVEAVLQPSGRVDDARGDGAMPSAREALRAAVARQERARGRERRRDPEAATEAWTALVSGRWSLVDRFERGGRRFIVARRNPLGVRDPRALTDRERAVAHFAALGKSNKLIAYELGLSTATVSTHLAAVIRKLRVGSRIDLVRLLHGLQPETPGG